jgi:hypothetical protein
MELVVCIVVAVAVAVPTFMKEPGTTGTSSDSATTGWGSSHYVGWMGVHVEQRSNYRVVVERRTKNAQRH